MGERKWTTSRAFLFAAIGSAVGLGNLWRFPYIAGENGGGAFILVYLACVMLFAVPLLMAELTIGRLGQGSAVSSMRSLTKPKSLSRGWMGIGWLSILVPAVGLSYYSVVAGWSVAYMVLAVSGAFSGLDATGSEETFADLTGSAPTMMAWHGVFMVTTVAIVARGLQRGVEQAVKILMPTLFLSLLALCVYAAVTADFVAGFTFMFSTDFSKITFESVLIAMGQAFFSVAVGVGAMVTYGAYLPKGIALPKAAFLIAGADAAVAILAGLAIFPVLFAAGLQADQGPSLLFVTMPIAFGAMPMGAAFGALFFFLISIAGLTSTIGMLEPVVSWLEEKRGFNRPVVAVVVGILIWMAGLGSVLSFNVLSDSYVLDFWSVFEEKTIFDITDYIVANFLIPINGLLISLYAGWALNKSIAQKNLSLPSLAFLIWRLLVRFVAPIGLVTIIVIGVATS
ncbi:MAG: sodium-dependent transporter [Pseudomonadota bacterium]